MAAVRVVAEVADPLRDRPILILAVFEFCLAAAYLALWKAAPDFRMFGGMGAYFALTGIDHSIDYFTAIPVTPFFSAFASLVLVEAVADALQIKNRRWTFLLWPIYGLQAVAAFTPSLAFARSWGLDASELALFWLSWQGLLRRSGRVRVVAGVFAAFTLVRITVSHEFQALTSVPRYFEIAGLRTYFTSPFSVLLGVLTLVMCFRDLLGDRREKQRLASELEAGRAVQQLLLSAPAAAGRHWTMDAVYMPAAEVGGDFYALLGGRNESSMLLIGDVSGKGLRAAMVVATILGAARQDASSGIDIGPAEMLRRLNETLCASGLGGFATCLCATIGEDAILRYANAGHLPPYLNGCELDCAGSLPLGLASRTEYEECYLRVGEGDQLTFLTDGVAEAQTQAGELFGFDRTRELAGRPAAEVAQAARQFGQQDDITVVTLTRLAATEEPSLPVLAVIPSGGPEFAN
jgi:Stage II sporulation protein E (SpoIIE)